MTFDNYQVKTNETAVYPVGDAGLLYVALGLANETGEVLGKLKKIVRGDYDEIEATPKVTQEIGDVFWYIAQVAKQLNFKLSKVLLINNVGLFTGGKPKNFLETVQVAVAANKNASILADGFLQGFLTKVDAAWRLRMIALELTTVSNYFKTDLSLILQGNLDKLADRKKRDKIKGDGDAR